MSTNAIDRQHRVRHSAGVSEAPASVPPARRRHPNSLHPDALWDSETDDALDDDEAQEEGDAPPEELDETDEDSLDSWDGWDTPLRGLKVE
jgi:hypothetical protein